MDLQHLILDGLDKNRIRELYLYKLPVLKTCDNWGAIKEIGALNFKGKHANYVGGLVKYMETIYFVTQARLDAVAAFRKWKFPVELSVTTEEEWKKKVVNFHAKQKKL